MSEAQKAESGAGEDLVLREFDGGVLRTLVLREALERSRRAHREA